MASVPGQGASTVLREIHLAPVRGQSRVDVLDIQRGIAILGILYMNIPYMGTNLFIWMSDARRLSWSAADQATWATIFTFWDGTQRGLFEFLFGAGVMVLTSRAMRPDDPVAIADLYYRRNLWLIAFGLIDIFVVLWVGDILLCYGLAALFLFPFRRLAPKALLMLGLLYALVVAIGWPGSGGGIVRYNDRVELLAVAPKLEAQDKSGAKMSEEDKERLKEFRKLQANLDVRTPPDKERQELIDGNRKAHFGTPLDLAKASWRDWYFAFVAKHGLFFNLLEAICGMFIGMALWKWGVIQGKRSTRFYLTLGCAAYLVGCGLRGWGAYDIMRATLEPKPIWIMAEFARLAVTLGHVCLINAVVRSKFGRWLLSPFKAAGRMAFTVYVTTSIVTIWFVFAPWGLGLWGRFGWAELALAATAINAVLLVAANLWLRGFVSGPLEWAWRSLSYWKRQPFRRQHEERTAPFAPGSPSLPG